LGANAAQGRAWVPGLREGRETIFAILPFFHAYGLTLCLTFAIQIGACLVLFPRFDVDQFLAAARRRPPTFLPGVPPMFDRIAAAARERGADLTSVRYAISGAMALAPAVVRRWEEVTGGILVEGYGMTETSPVALGNPMSAELRRTGTVGVPFPSTRVRIADSAQPSVDRLRGQSGEVLIQGPQVFSGYWRRPQETEATLLPDGWVRSGDVGVMDDDGFVTIVDRIKEIIITGGFNVYPSEVEDVLRKHPDVADVAVVGIPGAAEGEVVVAAVVPTEGSAFDSEAVRVWCRENIAGYKAPRRIIAVAELPRTEIGKVPRLQVRKSIMNSS
jgi:long-chain acyl-CoA synthetase